MSMTRRRSELGAVLPGLLGFDHVGIAVPDLDSAVSFYRDVLGLHVVHREENLDQQVTEVMLTSTENGSVGSQLQLLMPLTEDSVLNRFLMRRGSGLHHEPVPAARRSTLSTPRTLAAFCSSWSSTPRRIRSTAEQKAVAHAGT